MHLSNGNHSIIIRHLITLTSPGHVYTFGCLFDIAHQIWRIRTFGLYLCSLCNYSCPNDDLDRRSSWLTIQSSKNNRHEVDYWWAISQIKVKQSWSRGYSIFLRGRTSQQRPPLSEGVWDVGWWILHRIAKKQRQRSGAQLITLCHLPRLH